MLSKEAIEKRDMCYALYDGGWRSGDHDELMKTYGISDEEATDICETLEDMGVMFS